jgi:hypothetical protein
MTEEELMKQRGKLFRHFKGDLYLLLDIALHTETKETLVIYKALYGNAAVYARPITLFISEVDREKYPDVAQTYRFELLTD